MNFDYLFKDYGIQPLSFEEASALPTFAKQTRNNKIATIDKIDAINRILNSIKFSIKYAPELDDEEHAMRVQKLADSITEISVMADKTHRDMYDL